MIEVVFGDSMKAAVKIASMSEMISNIEDVVSIAFALDVGDINCEIDSEKRKQVFRKLTDCYDGNQHDLDNYFAKQRNDVEKLLSYAKEGHSIRIWKSNIPSSACGFSFVCKLLEDINCEIHTIMLPEYCEENNGTIFAYMDWGEVAAEKLSDFLYLDRKVSDLEKKLQSDLWKALIKENAPLRAIVNGKLISVPVDFYDHIITHNMPNGDFEMARFIGKILGKYALGIGDGWYALRINKMIEENKLEIVSNGNGLYPYCKVLRKVK